MMMLRPIVYTFLMHARIYRQTKNAMQSGKKNTKKWFIFFDHEKGSREIESVMGYLSSSDMVHSQLRLAFDTKEEAVEYAKRHDISYTVYNFNEPSTKIQSYTNNFQYKSSDK